MSKKTPEEILAEIEALKKELEAASKESDDEEEQEDTRPLGEKLGSGLGKLISGSKNQGTSFWGGLKDELVKGGVIKPSKKKRK